MTSVPPALEYGIYRDGDNNLDHEQAVCIAQALRTSLCDSSIEFVVEDTTSRRGFASEGMLRTERYNIRDGRGSGLEIGPPGDPSNRTNLAAFVARTLDRAEISGAKQTWIELVDHGGGDGGGLESASSESMMSERDIAGAIADGTARHARAHPEDANRNVDGVCANMCLMNTLGFADALSRVGVRYLAASPEIMLAPGVPSTVASAIAHNQNDQRAMARGIVDVTMGTHYPSPEGPYGATPAFSVLDTSIEKMDSVRRDVGRLNSDLVTAIVGDPSVGSHVRGDERSIRGMARAENGSLPWKADRPAIAFYEKLAGDARLPANVRSDAVAAEGSVRALILAHAESASFEPYGGRNYQDAAGPTIHSPYTRRQIDPWAPQVSETTNDFWKGTGGDRLARALTA